MDEALVGDAIQALQRRHFDGKTECHPSPD
jgi:hypothetical protein